MSIPAREEGGSLPRKKKRAKAGKKNGPAKGRNHYLEVHHCSMKRGGSASQNGGKIPLKRASC